MTILPYARSNARHSLAHGWFLALLALAGCTTVFNLPPPAEIRGGFTVPVDLPGQPTRVRVFADVGAFAKRQGFSRQSAVPPPNLESGPQSASFPAPERYVRGKITLEVTYQPARLCVSADLRSPPGGDRTAIRRFYADFRREYAASYGDESTIVETDDPNTASQPPIKGGRRAGEHPSNGSR